VKPRVGDVLGALTLALVLFALVAVLFLAALGESRRVHEEMDAEASVATRQL
jgi:hypothetical protein